MKISITPLRCLSLFAEIEALAVHREVYRFFDVTIGLRADKREVVRTFSEVYGRFRIGGDAERKLETRNSKPEAADTDAEYYVLTGGGPFDGPSLVADGEVHTLSEGRALSAYAHMVLARSFMRRVRSHLLIHAAALSWEGAGLALPSFSGGGKTTLAMELVRRGFSLLSDEIAAVGCADHLLHPFPRALGVREGTLALFGEEAQNAVRALRTVTGAEKSALKMEEAGIREGRPCSLRFVVLLGPGNDERAQERRGLYVVVNRLDDRLLEDLVRIPGIRRAYPFAEDPFPIVRLEIEPTGYVGAEIANVCVRHRAVVFAMVRDDEHTPDFRTRPRLEHLSVSAAASALAQRFQGGADSALLRERYGGKVGRMVWELTDVLQQTACYRLSQGRLDQMADMVCELVTPDLGTRSKISPRS